MPNAVYTGASLQQEFISPNTAKTYNYPANTQPNDVVVAWAVINGSGPISLVGFSDTQNDDSPVVLEGGAGAFTYQSVIGWKRVGGETTYQVRNDNLGNGSNVSVVMVCYRNVAQVLDRRMGVKRSLAGGSATMDFGTAPAAMPSPGGIRLGIGSAISQGPVTWTPPGGWSSRVAVNDGGNYSWHAIDATFGPGASIPDVDSSGTQEFGTFTRQGGGFTLVSQNSAPNTPTSLSPSGFRPDKDLSLSAVVTDPDFDNLYAQFQVATDSGFTNLVGTYTGTTVASSQTSSYYFIGNANTTYWLRARAIDTFAGAAGPYTAGQSFTTNRPPSAPGVPSVTPNPVNTTGTISWTAATEPDSQPMTYEVDLSTNGGATWTNISAWASSLSRSYNFASQPSTSAAQLRVRARDDRLVVGPYATSGNFTIQHNVAPNAATWDSPAQGSSLDRAQAQTLDWTFVDPDVGDTQSKYDLQYRIVGTTPWTTVTATTTVTAHTFAANALAAGDYEFQVLTYDSQGAAATAFSAIRLLTFAAQPGTPTITNPVGGATVSTPTVVLAYSTPTQQSYQVRKLGDLAGAPDTGNVLFDSGELVNTTARDYVLSTAVNNRFEHAQVRVKNSGLWSPWGSVRYLVSFTPPPQPTLRITEGARDILLSPVGGQPTPGAPQVASFDILRRVIGETDAGIRLATLLNPGSTFTDRTVQHRIDYEYQTVAVATNGTTSTSLWFPGRPLPDLTPTFTSS